MLSGHEDHPCLLVCKGKFFAGLEVLSFWRFTVNYSDSESESESE